VPTKFSLRDLIPEDDCITIVDVGAMAIGSADVDYAPLLEIEGTQVIGFEPDESECEKLNANAASDRRYLPYFIGAGGTATYYRTNHTMTGSLFEPNTELLSKFQNLAELTTLVETQDVETHRLDDLSEIGDVDLLKIDVQGAELDVFRGGRETLSKLTVLQTEAELVELYKGQPLFADIDLYLRDQGFQFHNFKYFGSRCYKPLSMGGNPNQGINQKLWTDAVYVRDFLSLEEVPVQKLLKMAVILNDMYQSFDLCHFVLAQADAKQQNGYADDYLQRLSAAASG